MTATARKCLRDIRKLEAMIEQVSERCVLQRDALRAWAARRKPAEGRKWSWWAGSEYEKRLAALNSDEVVLARLADELTQTVELYYRDGQKPVPPSIRRLLLASELTSTNLKKTATRGKGK